VPPDGQNFLGIADGQNPNATIDVVFTNTVTAFGGYWGAGTLDSNSPATIMFTFFDAADQQIGLPQSISYNRPSGDGIIEWHGWSSGTPFKRVRVTATTIFTLAADSIRAGASGFSVLTSIAPLLANQYLLQGSGSAGVVYTVQGNTNLNTTNWVALGTAPASTNGTLRFTNTSSFPQRFYRLKAP
jgi:hypothetical protein